jgi:hypothetical protein
MPVPNDPEWVAASCTRRPDGSISVSYYPPERPREKRQREKREARERGGDAPAPFKALACAVVWIAVLGAIIAAGWLNPAVGSIFIGLALWGIVDEFKGAKAEREARADEACHNEILKRLHEQEARVARLEAELADHKAEITAAA